MENGRPSPRIGKTKQTQTSLWIGFRPCDPGIKSCIHALQLSFINLPEIEFLEIGTLWTDLRQVAFHLSNHNQQMKRFTILRSVNTSMEQDFLVTQGFKV